MPDREPIEIVEIDLDYCNLTFGEGDCVAALGGAVTRKCFNTFFTCPVKQVYDKGVITYRFVQPHANYPKGSTFFPCLIDVSARSSIANIGGADSTLDSLGRRGTVKANFSDFAYHDRFMDKYQSQRVSGSAQLSGIGYNPEEKGTFWTKFRSRNPNYSGRPMRVITGYVDGGVLTVTSTRHFIMTNFNGPDERGNVSIEGKDILAIADNNRAVVPKPSAGVLTLDLSSTEMSFNITPEGIGDLEYPEEGFAAIGSELIQYTRVDDAITILRRGVNGTQRRAHKQGDTFQVSFSPRRERIDFVIRDILLTAGVPEDFIPFDEWQSEASRWASSLKLTADIMKPEGAAKLLGELAILGVTIWWDELEQKIRFLINRPVDTETVKELNDDKTNITVTKQDRDDDRLTEIIFRSVQIDPSRGVSADNFSRSRYTIDVESKLPDGFGDTKIKEINCRWLNQGSDSIVRILSIRYLNRFRVQPVRYIVEVDHKDDLQTCDVANISSYKITDEAGELINELAQVTMRDDVVYGHKVKLVLQQFKLDQRYGFVTDNDRPDYNDSTDSQKLRGAYFVGESGLFDDNTGAYRFS
jgi:hypothetical protein